MNVPATSRQAEILIEESRYASMIVVGPRGHGGFGGLLRGSVSSTVGERAQCPALVSSGALQLLEVDAATLPVGASA